MALSKECQAGVVNLDDFPEIAAYARSLISSAVLEHMHTEVTALANDIDVTFNNALPTSVTAATIRLWLASEMQNAAKAYVNWQAGFTEFHDGTPAYQIAQNVGQSSSSNFRRAYPDAKSVTEAYERALETGQPQTIWIKGYAIRLDPTERQAG